MIRPASLLTLLLLAVAIGYAGIASMAQHRPVAAAAEAPPVATTAVEEGHSVASGVSPVPGLAMAWGSDANGQLGSSACTPCFAPVTVGAGEGMTQTVIGVDAGGPRTIGASFQDTGHSLAVLSNGTVWAWGNDTDNQLGNGGASENELAPVQVPGVSNAVAIAAGGMHSLALLDNGTVMAWGSDGRGQIGDGDSGGTELPTVVSALAGVTAIAAGAEHSLALLNDGTVVAWGRDNRGQLGDSESLSNRSTPVPVSGLTNVVAIAAGRGFSLALLSNGTVMGWGSNHQSELGNGETDNQKPTPIAVSSLTSVKAIAAGAQHALALRTDGTVRAWGAEFSGELGDGLPKNELATTPITVPGMSGVRAIDAGSETSYAIDLNGRVRAWGDDADGQVGDGTPSTDRPSPTSVIGPLGTGGATVIAAGQSHTLAIVPLCNGERVTHVGTSGSQTMIGTSGSDVIHGLAGIDRIRGGAGNDTICGGDGDDILRGDTGDNDIFGDAGSDTAEFPEGAVNANLLPGQRFAIQGADEDSLISIENLEGSEQGDTLTGSVGANRIDGNGGSDDIKGSFGDDTLNGGSGNDDISGGPDDDVMNGGSGADDFDGDQDIDTVSYLGETAALIIDLQLDRATFPSTTEDLLEIENITGGNSGDIIIGDPGTNILRGGDGEDIVAGREGEDEIFGDDDNDNLSGGLNADQLDGGEGSDTAIFGEEAVELALANDLATLASGNDAVLNIENATGSAQTDTLVGDSGPNVLEGGGGADTIRGLEGNDTLTGGPGADTIEPLTGVDEIDGGTERDTLIYASVGVNVNLTLGTTTASDGNDSVDAIENVDGSSVADILVGDDEDNVLRGLGGSDILLGRVGNDLLEGGELNDMLVGAEGKDELFGGTENDTLIGGDAADTLSGEKGTDTISYSGSTPVIVDLSDGSNNQDDTILDTNGGSENLTGSSGNDTLTGTADSNVLDGFEGDDTLKGGGGADTFRGDIGSDTVDYAGSTAVTLNLSTGANNQGDTLFAIENVRGSSQGDTLTGNSGPNILDGAVGADTLDGAGGIDSFVGDIGLDTVDYTGSTAVTLNLGDGSNNQGDTFAGIENVLGSSFGDTLTGDGNANVLDGADGADTLNGAGGADTFIGGLGLDTLDYTGSSALIISLATGNNNQGDTLSEIENVRGTAFVDNIIGNGQANILEGGGSGDTLQGGPGSDDQLFGNDGADSLNGGPGVNDLCDGGPGVDSFAASCEVQQN
ncbi:MAG: hypothetical protein WEB00_13975 [Dehalococcoidia bacterium]